MVGRLGERVEVRLPLGIIDCGRPVGESVADWVEAQPISDAGLQDIGDLAGIVEGPTGDRVGQDLLRVMAGELDAAEQTCQGGGTVLGGDCDPLIAAPRGQSAVTGTPGWVRRRRGWCARCR
jgi:hypothetical protein